MQKTIRTNILKTHMQLLRTNDKNKNNLIHSIVSNGYKLTLKDSDIHYIKKALVKVYEYKNVNIESEKKKL